MAKIFTILLLFGLSLKAGSQTLAVDTVFATVASTNIFNTFVKNPNFYSGIYNGRDHDEYRPTENEHPYLFLDWTESQVDYSNKLYENVPLLFDLSSDEIITEHNSGSKISLIKEKVNFFVIRNHRYEFLNYSDAEKGFCEVLYSGNVRIIARRKKKKEEKIVGNVIHYEFNETVRYYLIKGGATVQLSNKRSLIKILSGNNADLKKRLSAERLESNKEKSFARLAMMYDQLSSLK